MNPIADKEILFKERQRFTQWWIWLILLGINGLFLFGVFKQVAGGEQFGDKPMSNTGLLILTAISILITILIANFHLDTIISREGIYVRFFPFHLRFKRITWDAINKSFVRQYRPIGEFGGWGLRYGLSGSGKAYNVSGNKGLQLEFRDNKKLLIGTQKPDELTKVLKAINQLKQ